MKMNYYLNSWYFLLWLWMNNVMSANSGSNPICVNYGFDEICVNYGFDDQLYHMYYHYLS